MAQDSIFLTGGTGALGCWIARKVLNKNVKVHALSRSSRDITAGERLLQSLHSIGAVAGTNLNVVEGDILQPGLANERFAPNEIDTVIHCAASTEFLESASDITVRSNIDGLRNVLEFARQRRAGFVHISTAYVAGTRGGPAFETQIDEGQAFNNAYEMSKCRGELLVRRWAQETGLPAIILRPSIVLGDSREGRALRFNTIYDMMRTFDLLGSVVRDQEIRIVANSAATKNIIPVDYFADVSWRIIQRGISGTYHIVHPNPITLATLRGIFVELFGCEGATLVSQDQFTARRPTSAERMCHRAMAIYRPYMTAPEPRFDRTATDAALAGSDMVAPSMDVEYFRRLLNYARSVDWGRRPAERPVLQPPPAPVAEYFDVFLARKVGQRLLPDLHRISSQFGIHLNELPREHWAIDVRQGVLHAISTNGMKTECRFRLNVPTFLEIVSGRLTPQNAFFKDRIHIEGDMQTGLRLAAVFGQFFRRFPFLPTDAEECAA